MSLLRKSCVACVPIVEAPVHEFKESKSVEEIVPVFDKDGNKVRSYKQRKVVLVSIPQEQWENKGVSASLFSLENQFACGVNVSEFTGNFIGLDLDVSSQLGDKFIDSVNSFVATEKAKQNVESKNEE